MKYRYVEQRTGGAIPHHTCHHKTDVGFRGL